MSVLAFPMLFIPLALGVSTGTIVARASRRFGRPRLGRFVAVLLGTVVVIVSFMPVATWLQASTTTTLIDLNPREGEQKLASLGIPAGTTRNFNYRRSLVGIELLADFEMSEADFQQWMQLQDWTPVPFEFDGDAIRSIEVPGSSVTVFPEVHPVRGFDLSRPLVVTRGYCCFSQSDLNPDATTTLIYDLDAGRVYVECALY